MAALMIATAIIAASLLAVAVWRTLHSHRVAVRQAQSDELRFLLSPIIPHSIEDAARRAGC